MQEQQGDDVEKEANTSQYENGHRIFNVYQRPRHRLKSARRAPRAYRLFPGKKVGASEDVLTPQLHEALDGLQSDAYAERQQKHAVEETPENLSSLPSIGEGLGGLSAL